MAHGLQLSRSQCPGPENNQVTQSPAPVSTLVTQRLSQNKTLKAQTVYKIFNYNRHTSFWLIALKKVVLTDQQQLSYKVHYHILSFMAASA